MRPCSIARVVLTALTFGALSIRAVPRNDSDGS